MSLQKLYREAVKMNDELFEFMGTRSALGWAHTDEHRAELMKQMSKLVNKHGAGVNELEEKLREKVEASIKNLATELRCSESMALYRARVELNVD